MSFKPSNTFLLVCILFSLTTEAVFASISQLEKAVVKIRVQERGVTATGFIINLSDNLVYIVTSAHVIWDGDKLYAAEVVFKTDPGTKVSASIHQLEERVSGLAVLKVKREQVPANIHSLELAELPSQLEKGDELQIIGFPTGAAPWAVVKGNYVGMENRMLIFTGAVDSGASGSPIIKDNKVFGVVSEAGKFSNAIPLTTLIEVLSSWGVMPNEADKYNAKADLAFGKGEFKQAGQAWLAALQIDASNIQASQGLDKLATQYLKQAQIALQLQDCEQAETQLHEAESVRPGHEQIIDFKKMIKQSCLTERKGSVEAGLIYALSSYAYKETSGDVSGQSDGNLIYNLGMDYKIRDGQFLDAQLQYGTLSYTDFSDTEGDDWIDMMVVSALVKNRTPWVNTISWDLGAEYWSWKGSLEGQDSFDVIFGFTGLHSLPPRGLNWKWNVSAGFNGSQTGNWKAETGLKGRLQSLPLEYYLALQAQLYESGGDNYYKHEIKSAIVKLAYLF